jgi:hypothetical protein
MISNQDKLYLINLKLDFWGQRLQESKDAILPLNNLGNQLKIEGNLVDIDRYNKIIEGLIQEKEALTNQG